MAALLHSHPYHLDALLTMHDLYRSMAENSYAGGLLGFGQYIQASCGTGGLPALQLDVLQYTWQCLMIV